MVSLSGILLGYPVNVKRTDTESTGNSTELFASGHICRNRKYNEHCFLETKNYGELRSYNALYVLLGFIVPDSIDVFVCLICVKHAFVCQAHKFAYNGFLTYNLNSRLLCDIGDMILCLFKDSKCSTGLR